MKLSAAAVLALFAAHTQGFSVTMSSNYLERLGSGGASLSSFASYSAPTPSPMPYSPPSYSAPPAQPVQSSSYTSGFGNLPANNDLNYLKTLGGGGSMKSGRNFSGVSSSYQLSNSGSSYLDALKGKTLDFSSASSYSAPAPMPYSTPSPSYSAPSYSAPAPSYSAPAPAPANGSYLDNLKNSPVSSSYSAMHNSFASATSNYSGVNPRPAKVRSAFGSYLENL